MTVSARLAELKLHIFATKENIFHYRQTVIDSFSHTLLNMTKTISFPNLHGTSAVKRYGPFHYTLQIRQYVSRYDVCNPTLPGRNVNIRAFNVGLTIINNTSYLEQTYIEYVRFAGHEINI